MHYTIQSILLHCNALFYTSILHNGALPSLSPISPPASLTTKSISAIYTRSGFTPSPPQRIFRFITPSATPCPLIHSLLPPLPPLP